MRLWALLCAVLGLAGLALWAGSHPLAPAWACGAAAAAWIMLALLNPAAALAGAAALWPVIDLTQWTGRIHLTESDALVLATLAGLGVREALRGWVELPGDGAGGGGSHSDARATAAQTQTARENGWGLGLAGLVLFGLLAITVAVSAGRGLMAPAAPGAAARFTTDWLAGLDTPLNALRLAKPYAFALLLIPFLQRALTCDGERVTRALVSGMALGLGTCSLAALWERVAYPGLTNFSADYRTTALFWEMNVGGAALDGWIALTVPFAVALAARAHSRSGAALAAMLGSLGAYAALTTFSRGLYAAVGASLLVLLATRIAGARAREAGPDRQTAPSDRPVPDPRTTPSDKPGLSARALEFAFAACALTGLPLAFQGGGYRGAGALMGFAIAAFVCGPVAAGLGAARTFAALLLASGASAALIAAADLIGKGPYLAFGAAFTATLALIHARMPISADARRFPAAVLAMVTGMLAANVGAHWGGASALAGAAAGALLIGVPLLAQCFTRSRLWRTDSRSSAGLAIILVAGGLGAATLGSYYANARFSTVDSDLRGRQAHWADSMSLARTPTQKLLGIGMGRYPQDYFWTLPQREFPGTLALAREGDNRFLRLGGPRYSISFGDMFRVSQRVATDARAPFRFSLRVRTPADVGLHLEVCRKHLLYASDCSIAHRDLKGSPDWQALELPEREGPMSPFSLWYAPRLAFFSVGLLGAGNVEVDDLRVLDADGRSLLANGDFSGGIDRWFFTSDRHHLPWHAKSMFVHLYVEQGLAGLLAVGLAIVAACVRLARAASRGHPFAPVALASIVGFVVVGVFDSLLDAPRIALPFLLLLWLGLVARPPVRRLRRARSGEVSRGGEPSAGSRPASPE